MAVQSEIGSLFNAVDIVAVVVGHDHWKGL